ncbi:hypothetical protein [Micromonospora sediminicola]|uniref:hypothetical protein n=1 Tax=Micromonospora sediminicola TaxID=946078 RepID=UPI0037A10C32
MADGAKSMDDLVDEAKRAILERNSAAAARTQTGALALRLAMAFTVLERGKLPGSDVDNK